MPDYATLNADELATLKSSMEKRYADFKSRDLSLDMTRGKPCTEQLDLSLEMLGLVTENDFKTKRMATIDNISIVINGVWCKRISFKANSTVAIQANEIPMSFLKK